MLEYEGSPVQPGQPIHIVHALTNNLLFVDPNIKYPYVLYNLQDIHYQVHTSHVAYHFGPIVYISIFLLDPFYRNDCGMENEVSAKRVNELTPAMKNYVQFKIWTHQPESVESIEDIEAWRAQQGFGPTEKRPYSRIP
jgi:hypothetical protein